MMHKKNPFFAVLVLFAMVMALAGIATAAEVTEEIELTTRSVILVDRSGSMEDREKAEQILAQLNPDGEVSVVYFDSRDITTSATYSGGWDSSICEAIDAAIDGGFDHITVITDGEQWPADYSSLGIYSDVDIRVVLTEGVTPAAGEMLQELETSLVYSNLVAVLPDGEEIVYQDAYQPPKYTVTFEMPEGILTGTDGGTTNTNGNGTDGTGTNGVDGINGTDGTGTDGTETSTSSTNSDTTGIDATNGIDGTNGDTTSIDHNCTHKCKWWCLWALPLAILALVLALLALLFGLCGWQRKVATKVRQGAYLLLDVSGSMKRYARKAAKLARRLSVKKVIAFAGDVRKISPDKVASLRTGGQTLGVEALKKASTMGWKDIVLISDLDFNGAELIPEEFGKVFRTITVVVPKGYNCSMVQKLKEIADRVEVISL